MRIAELISVSNIQVVSKVHGLGFAANEFQLKLTCARARKSGSKLMSHRKYSSYLLLALWLCFLTGVFSAQVPTDSTDEKPVKVNTVLVNVPVIVSDLNGRNQVGLTKENFSVTQDGQKQTIEFFADHDGPMTVAIIIDTSGSTGSVIGDITDAARDFVALFGPDDKGMIVSFDNGVNMLLTAFTSDKGKLRGAINHASTAEGPDSVMNDAVYRIVTKEFASIKGKKAIIVLTDGDVNGKISHQKLLDTLIESDILVYPIFYQTRRLLPSKVKTISFSELVKIPPVNFLNSLAVMTGGRLYVANGSDFRGAFQSIAAELKKQYVIGFYPTNTEGGNSNNIKIEVDRKDALVRSKSTIRIKTPASKEDEKRSPKKKN